MKKSKKVSSKSKLKPKSKPGKKRSEGTKSRLKNEFGAEAYTYLLDARDESFLIVDFLKPVNHKKWFQQNKDTILNKLLKHGVVYLRNGLIPKEQLVELVESLLPKDALADSYSGGTTARPRVDRNLFLTTEIPAENAILQHYEMSYMVNAPKKIFFYSNLPAEHAGATPVAFSRRIKKELNPALWEEFKKRGICYVRNYYADARNSWKVLLTWQRAFEVNSKAELEDAAKKQGFQFEWTQNGGLRTVNKMPGIITHPVTQEEFLYNHAWVLHTYSENGVLNPFRRAVLDSLDPDEKEKILSLPMMDQPYLVTWGDTNEVIPTNIIEEVYEVYNKNKISLNWRQGDLMIVDNILASHGRDPFKGKRETFALLSTR